MLFSFGEDNNELFMRTQIHLHSPLTRLIGSVDDI